MRSLPRNPQPPGRHRLRNWDETRAIAHPKKSMASRWERITFAVRAWLWDARRRGDW